jgi:hypothetical protein
VTFRPGDERTPYVLRRRPALCIRVVLEETEGVLYIDADSHEDELRLCSWLRRTDGFRAIRIQIESFLDWLDELDDQRRAA